jgi:hypothetical protein
LPASASVFQIFVLDRGMHMKMKRKEISLDDFYDDDGKERRRMKGICSDDGEKRSETFDDFDGGNVNESGHEKSGEKSENESENESDRGMSVPFRV